MKPIRFLAVLGALALLLSGCAANQPASQTAAPSEVPASAEAAEPAVGPASEPVFPEPVSTEPAEPVSTEPVLPAEPQFPELTFADPEAPRPAEDPAQVLQLLAEYDYAARWDFYEKSHPEEAGDEPVFDGQLEDPAAQILPEGVQRGSMCKTDGSFLYLVDSYGLIIQSAAGADSRQLSYTEIDRNGAGDPGSIRELYLTENLAAAVYTRDEFGTDENGSWFDRTETHVAVFDVSDPAAPVFLYDRGIDGGYLAGRLIDGTLYLITNNYFWEVPRDMDPAALLPKLWIDGEAQPISIDHVLLCQSPNSTALTGVLAVSLGDGRVVDAWACTDVTMALTLDADYLYLARGIWSSAVSEPRTEGVYTVTDSAELTRTEIKRLRREPDGSLTPDGVCWVPGTPTCESAIQAAAGKLWVVTLDERGSFSTYADPEQGWSNDRAGVCLRSNRLTVLDEDLQPVSSLEHLAEDDTVVAWSLRDGSGWLRCYQEDLHLRMLDLSDPENPRETGTLEPGGWSWLLRPYGEQEALGLAGDANGDLILTVYRRDPEALEPVGTLQLENPGQSVLYEPTGLWTDAQIGRAGFPVQLETGFGYALVDIRQAQPALVKLVELDYLPASAESLLVGDLLYVCSPGTTYVLDPESGDLITTISNAVG